MINEEKKSNTSPFKKDSQSWSYGPYDFNYQSYTNSSNAPTQSIEASQDASNRVFSNRNNSQTSSQAIPAVDVPQLLAQLVDYSKIDILSEINAKVDKRIQESDQKIQETANKKMAEITQKLESEKGLILSEIQTSKSQLQDVRNSVLTTIALFASFFTFISVSINIYSKSTIIESIGLTIILWSCIFFFLFTFFIFVYDMHKRLLVWIPCILSLAISYYALQWISNNKEQDKDLNKQPTDNKCATTNLKTNTADKKILNNNQK